jgi:ApaG protein
MPDKRNRPSGLACIARVTENIEVVVRPQFSEEQSQPEKNKYFWTYAVEITNHRDDTRAAAAVATGRSPTATATRQDVRGPGVVGEQPVLKPGETFRYTSGCPLTTPQGIMVGSYQMARGNGDLFEVQIPAFSLDSPHETRLHELSGRSISPRRG